MFKASLKQRLERNAACLRSPITFLHCCESLDVLNVLSEQIKCSNIQAAALNSENQCLYRLLKTTSREIILKNWVTECDYGKDTPAEMPQHLRKPSIPNNMAVKASYLGLITQPDGQTAARLRHFFQPVEHFWVCLQMAKDRRGPSLTQLSPQANWILINQ